MLSTQPVVAPVPPADVWSTSPLPPLPLTPPGRAERRPCAPAPAKPPPEIAGSEPPVAPPAWEPNKGLDSSSAPQRPPGILLPMTDEEKQRKAVVEKAKAQGIPLKVRLPDAALGVVRPLRPGCPAKKRLPWPELMEEMSKCPSEYSTGSTVCPSDQLEVEAQIAQMPFINSVPVVAAR
ncbi:Uncharacterized protein SCF082_LOCUS14768 [Durusdinium trenchii]|uniref:Uncharacterized protein n=1 Tax=Durusdinium trenchii TaxID=1381693 RepID=A0ABP0K0A1_9DINO